MARVVCFSDTTSLVRAVRQSISGREHSLFPLPGSRLTDDLRRTVRRAAPDVVVLELTRALDNPHLFFFLRSDAATRDVPVIVVADDPSLEPYAEALGADVFVAGADADAIRRALSRYLPAPAPMLPPASIPATMPALAPALPPALRRPLRPIAAPLGIATA